MGPATARELTHSARQSASICPVSQSQSLTSGRTCRAHLHNPRQLPHSAPRSPKLSYTFWARCATYNLEMFPRTWADALLVGPRTICTCASQVLGFGSIKTLWCRPASDILRHAMHRAAKALPHLHRTNLNFRNTKPPNNTRTPRRSRLGVIVQDCHFLAVWSEGGAPIFGASVGSRTPMSPERPRAQRSQDEMLRPTVNSRKFLALNPSLPSIGGREHHFVCKLAGHC